MSRARDIADKVPFLANVTSDVQTQIDAKTDYTSSCFNTDFTAKSTSDLSEGTNLYASDANIYASFDTVSTSLIPDQNCCRDLGSATKRWNDIYTAGSTIDIAGTKLSRDASGDLKVQDDSNNLKKIIVDEIQIGSGANLLRLRKHPTHARLQTINCDVSIQKSELNNNDTDDLTEGSTNLYHTTARVRGAISVTGSGTYDNSTGVINVTGGVTCVNENTGSIDLCTCDITESGNLYYTDARARAAITGGTGVTVTSGEVAIGQAVGTTNNVTFNCVTVTNDLIADDIVTNTLIACDTGACVSVCGNTLITGNLTVCGTTTQVSCETQNIGSINTILGTTVTNPTAANAGGLKLTLCCSADPVPYASMLYASTNDEWVFNKPIRADCLYGKVSNVSNHYTCDIAECNDLYYTDARARGAISVTGSGSYNASTGVITVTGGVTCVNENTGSVNLCSCDITESGNLYFTNSRARGAVSVTDAGGDGSMTYNSTTGVFTFTGPSASEVRAHLSSSGDISYNSTTGVISATVYKTADFNTDFATKKTCDLAEDTDLYYTDARARAAISVSGSLAYNNSTGVMSFTDAVSQVNAKTGAVVLHSCDINECVNQYYTDARARSAISVSGSSLTYNSTTGVLSLSGIVSSINGLQGNVNLCSCDITESGNLYFTNARADARITNALIDEDNMASDSATKIPSQQSVKAYVDAQVASKDNTDEITEGSTNLYYTNARVDAHLNQSNPTTGYVLSWNGSDYAWIDNAGYTNTDFDSRLAIKTTDNLSEGSSNLYYTNARADARIVAANLTCLADVDSVSSSDDGKVLYYDHSTTSWKVKSDADTQCVTCVNSKTGAINLYTCDVDEFGSSPLYFTDSRARASICVNSGVGAYNSTTGEITLPTDVCDSSILTLCDVSEGPATNSYLYYNGSAFCWITSTSAYNQTCFNTHLEDASINKLCDVNSSMNPGTGDYIRWDGSQWDASAAAATPIIELDVTVDGGKFKFDNGDAAPFIYFVPGFTYKLIQSGSSNAGHPLVLSEDVTFDGNISSNATTTPPGVSYHVGGTTYSTATDYNTNFTNAATTYVQFVVPTRACATSAKPRYSYGCANHTGMGKPAGILIRVETTDDLPEGTTNKWATTTNVATALNANTNAITFQGATTFCDTVSYCSNICFNSGGALTFNSTNNMCMDSAGDYIVFTHGTPVKRMCITCDGASTFISPNVTTMTLNRNDATNGKVLSIQKQGTEVYSISTDATQSPSDKNIKCDIEPLQLGLEFVTCLDPISYRTTVSNNDDPKQFGFIAQEMEEALTELGISKNTISMLQHVPNDNEKESDYWLDYVKMIPILTNAIKELSSRLKALEDLK